MVKGNAFLTNNLNPLTTLFGSSSIASEIECLIECKKQKYTVKASSGDKYQFNIKIEK